MTECGIELPLCFHKANECFLMDKKQQCGNPERLGSWDTEELERLSLEFGG